MIKLNFNLEDLPVEDITCPHLVRKAVFIQLNDEDIEVVFECPCVLRHWKGQFSVLK